jgi:hypothetical protein
MASLVAAALPRLALRADHEDFVIVSATANKAYTEHKFAHGSPRPETYVLYQGKFFGGMTHDPSVEHTTFMAIAKTLAPDLAKQNYLPTRDARAANLLIVVNWGTTMNDPLNDKSNTQYQFELKDLMSAVGTYNAGMASTAGGTAGVAAISNLNINLAQADTDTISQESDLSRNARLLGYTGALAKEGEMDWATPSGVSSAESSHLQDLLTERYFVILQAYDYQKLQRDHPAHPGAQLVSDRPRAAAGPPQPVWSVRMNIKADGNNFTEALPAMSHEAAGYFGKQMDDLVDRQSSVGSQSRVDVGAPKVIKYEK